jgi:hypothetical protein
MKVFVQIIAIPETFVFVFKDQAIANTHIAFEEVVGKVNIVPEQIEVGNEKVGVTFAIILIF